jgi:aryl-alcohol dehydrogenase-like predicted oxidoreductase
MGLFVPDIIQAPVNIFDQRLLVSGHLAHLKNRGVEIHARSVFLQGLLLMEPGSAPDFCAPIAGHFARYVRFLEQSDLTKLEAALAFIAQEKHIDVALVGVSSSHDFEEIISAISHNCSRDARIPNASDWAVHDEAIINPAMWPMVSPS